MRSGTTYKYSNTLKFIQGDTMQNSWADLIKIFQAIKFERIQSKLVESYEKFF